MSSIPLRRDVWSLNFTVTNTAMLWSISFAFHIEHSKENLRIWQTTIDTRMGEHEWMNDSDQVEVSKANRLCSTKQGTKDILQELRCLERKPCKCSGKFPAVFADSGLLRWRSEVPRFPFHVYLPMTPLRWVSLMTQIDQASFFSWSLRTLLHKSIRASRAKQHVWIKEVVENFRKAGHLVIDPCAEKFKKEIHAWCYQRISASLDENLIFELQYAHLRFGYLMYSVNSK